MSVIDWVKHSLPMKLKDGKRHVFPTLASMVYLKDGTTPITDGNGNWNADKALDAEKLGGKLPEHYATADDLTKIDRNKLGENDLRPQNLLVNSDFEVTSDSGSYVAARWEKTGNITFTKDGDVKKISSSSGYNYILQRVWADGRDKGKTYTAIVTLPDGSKVAGVGTFPTNDVTSSTVVNYTSFGKGAIVLIKEPYGGVLFRIDAVETGAEVEFLSADLFEGEYSAETAPPHVPNGYYCELLACEVVTHGAPICERRVINNFTTTEEGFVADARTVLTTYRQINRVRVYTFGPVVVLAISTGTSVAPSSGLIETLPEELRPPTTVVSLCAYNGGSGNTTGFIHVLPTGEVYLYKMDGYTGASGATYANANITYVRS